MHKTRLKKSLGPISPDCWLEPGTRTFAVFFPELDWRWNTNTMDEKQIRQLADRQIWVMMERICRQHRRRDFQTIEDLCHDLKVRVAEMDAASRYTSEMGEPLAYLNGIAETVAREKFVRRQPPRMGSLDLVREPAAKGEQHRRNARMRRAMAKRCRQHLTPGEQRAIEAEFGPVFGGPVKAKRPRRPNDPRVLRHAVEVLRRLLARNGGQ